MAFPSQALSLHIYGQVSVNMFPPPYSSRSLLAPFFLSRFLPQLGFEAEPQLLHQSSESETLPSTDLYTAEAGVVLDRVLDTKETAVVPMPVASDEASLKDTKR